MFEELSMNLYSCEEIAEAEKRLKSLADNVCQSIPIHSPDKLEAVKTIAEYYSSTCLPALGSWAFDQILRFDGLCKRGKLDFVTVPEALRYIHSGSSLDLLARDSNILPEFNFKVLNSRDYWYRLGDMDRFKEIPIAHFPDWVYDEEANEYVAVQYPPDFESAKDMSDRTEESFKNALHHHSQRRGQVLDESEFEKFSGKREAIGTSENHYFWLYQRMVKELSFEQIHEAALETDKDVHEDSIRKAVARTAELLGVTILKPLVEESDLD